MPTSRAKPSSRSHSSVRVQAYRGAISSLSRNHPCPCGSGAKFKRCCQDAVDAAARIGQIDGRVGAEMLAWVEVRHGARLQSLMRTSPTRAHWFDHSTDGLRLTWAMSDATPSDGGPSLAARYALRPDLSPAHRRSAERIAGARVGLYRVRAAVAGAWVEIERLDLGGAHARVMSETVSRGVEPGGLVVARVMDEADGVVSFWGPARICRPADERKWLAFLRVHDLSTEDGSLAAIDFIPEDHAEPLPEGLRPFSTEWDIDDDMGVCEQLADCLNVAELGREIGPSEDAWAFAWLDHPGRDAADLGGCPEQAGRVEVARLVVHPTRLVALSSSPRIRAELERWVEGRLPGLSPTLLRAA